MNGINIFEYLQTDHPWFDTKNYTTLQIWLFSIGASLWLVAYTFTIRNAWQRMKQNRTLDIPVTAVVLNFGCEISTSIFFVPNMGNALVLAYWLWMVFDIFIVIAMFRVGREQFTMPQIRNNFSLILMLGLVISFIVQCTFILQYDLPMAPLDSYVINLVMSILFINLFFAEGPSGYSKTVAWSKFLGTGIISVMFYSKYPGNNFLTALYISCALFDILYICLLYKKEKNSPAVA